MLRALAADGPDPGYGDALGLYGWLIGSWEIDNRYFDEADGAWHAAKGLWHFGWILRGRGIQDVLTGLSSAGAGGGAGTTVRVYDPNIDAWRVSWFGAFSGEYCTLVGRPDADGAGIFQEGAGVDGRPLRWVFDDIQPDSFHWEGFVSDDGGDTWRLEQEMHARRVTVEG